METPEKNIIQKIQELGSEYTDKQHHLADFIINNYKEAAFMNSVQLSKAANVSNATVIRFASFLGYNGFNSMSHDLQTLVQQEMSSVDRVSLLTGKSIRQADGENQFRAILYLEEANVHLLLQNLERDNVIKAVHLMNQVQNIIVAGFQVAEFPAGYFRYALSKIRQNVFQFQNWDHTAYTSLSRIESSAAAVVIALPRYPNLTIQFMQELVKRKIPIILITDSMLFPYCDLADIVFPLGMKYLSYVDPLSAVFCMINCLVIELVNCNPDEAKHTLNEFEKFVAENFVYFRK